MRYVLARPENGYPDTIDRMLRLLGETVVMAGAGLLLLIFSTVIDGLVATTLLALAGGAFFFVGIGRLLVSKRS